MISAYKENHLKTNLDQISIEAQSLEDCPVCLEGYTQGQKVLVTPCGHYYHFGCLAQWLNTKVQDTNIETCALCRREIKTLKPLMNNYLQVMSDAQKVKAARHKLEEAVNCLQKHLDGREHYPSIAFIRDDLEFARANGLEAESLPLRAKCAYEHAKLCLQKYIDGRANYSSIAFIRDDLEFARANGLEAESLPLRAKCAYEHAKLCLQKYIDGRANYSSIAFIRDDLEFARANGLEAESLPLRAKCALEHAKLCLQKHLDGRVHYNSLTFIRVDLEFASANGFEAEAKDIIKIMD